MQWIENYKQLQQAKIYCVVCQDIIKGAEITPISNDAEQLEFPCPGCGWDLFYPVDQFEFYGIAAEPEENNE